MNVLLLTYSFNYNYGGLLQAYATAQYLSSIGHEVVVPTAHPAHMVGNTSFWRGMGLKGGNPLKAVLRRFRQAKRYRRFDAFRSRLPLAPQLSSKEAINAALARFDVILTGSDQTFNTKFMPKYDSYFFQGFHHGGPRKVSYASCFGTREQKPEIIARAAPDLKNFDALAVRNEVSRQIIADLIGIESTVVVDPTLLHDFNELKSDGEGAAVSSRYIMVYALDTANFPIAERIIGQLKESDPDLEVHFVNGEKNFDKPAWASHLINDYGPLEFLRSIQNSAYVVTDSFHGVIFTQKFDRPCIAYSSGWRSERIVSMMRDFNASDLLVLENDPNVVRAAVTRVVRDGARLSISDDLESKILRSKRYLNEALGNP